MEHSLLPHLTHAFAGGAVHACEGRAPHRSAAPCPFSQVFSRERKKDMKRKQVDVRDMGMNCQRPPEQVWFLQRPCCRNCFWQGCVTPACEKAVLLGEGAHSGLGGCSSPKPLTFMGQFEDIYYTERYKLLIFGSIPHWQVVPKTLLLLCLFVGFLLLLLCFLLP